MKQVASVTAALFLLCSTMAVTPGVAREMSLPTSTVCSDPASACWTQGKLWYQGVSRTWGFGVLPGWVIPTVAGVRFLNTGATIPHLVVAINPQGGRAISAPAATLRTGSSARTLMPRRLTTRLPMVAWDLGGVPDGAVIWFQVHVVATTRHPAQAWENLYGGITATGSVRWAAVVHPEFAPLRP